jgi:hypothetical protein
MAACGRMGNHSETLLRYRSLSSSASATNRKPQIANASKAASRYAHTVCPSVSEDEWYRLHRFSSIGERTKATSLLSLAKIFSAMRSEFERTYGTDCPELNASIAGFAQHLRWRCTKTLPSFALLANFRALRAAQAFDPDQSGLRSAFARRITRWLNRNPSIGTDTRAWGPKAGHSSACIK